MIKRAELLVLFLLSAVVSLNSCSKKDSHIKSKYLRTITVMLQLPDSDSKATVEIPYINSAAIISAVDVYFYNIENGEIYKKSTLTKSEIIEISSETGLTFPYLSAEVNGVAIVANNNSAKNITTYKGENIYDLFNRTLHIAHEQLYYNVTLYGKSREFLKIESENDAPRVDYFTVAALIKPIVARMEISELECVDMNINGAIRKLLLHSMFIDHTYTQVALDSKKVLDISYFKTEATAVEALPSAWWIYSYLSDFPHIPNSNHNETPFSPDVINPTQLGDGVFAFHFIPSGTRPWVRIYMRNFMSNDAWYLNIKGFTKAGAPMTFDPGFIYKIKMSFEENDLTVFDDSQKAISVEVTVQDWSIVNEIIPSTNK